MKDSGIQAGTNHFAHRKYMVVICHYIHFTQYEIHAMKILIRIHPSCIGQLLFDLWFSVFKRHHIDIPYGNKNLVMHLIKITAGSLSEINFGGLKSIHTIWCKHKKLTGTLGTTPAYNIEENLLCKKWDWC